MTGTDHRILAERVELVPLAVEDADEMAEVLGGEELYTFIGGSPPTRESLRARYTRLVASRSADGSQDWYNWIVRRGPDGQAVGTVQATVTDGGRHAEIAWVVGLAWQGQGYASEAATALAGWLGARGVSRITAHVHPDHHASMAVARHAGLEPTGDFHDGERLWLRE
ncbi:GNAT family N-acetyltransferase [Sphaerisporangium perillae]|uniref:GNAT family N-acetyltransferase n=1 Tax=Sphaerisporangium perillae TaxID=2935860 RepID=UPI00200D8B8D|nr:GNAT family N-acetyltransferase [Sphaerisporangium perillae]